MTTQTNSPSEAQVKAFRVDMRCSGKSMKSQQCSADRVNWLKPVTAQGALQRARRIRRQRHACVQGGASSLGCGVTILTARTRALASRLGNLHVFKGPDDFNVFGYFYVRLYWTGFGFQANSVEEYVLLSALLHDSVGLERTWDQERSPGLMSGQLNLAITGLMLLTVITIHLFLSRFADTEPRTLRSPSTLINWHPSWLTTLKFLWTDNTHVHLVPYTDFPSNEYKVLKNPVWCGFYNMAVVIVITHDAEFDIIHPLDVVEKYAPDAVGALGDGGEGDDEEDDSSEGGCTMEEVAKYNKKGDVWVVLNGSALHVSNFWSLHPGGELTILTSAGKDATAEFDMIHPPDVVEKYAPDAVIGTLEDGGEGGDDEEDDSSEGGYTMEEVAKHNKKGDVWVVLNGRVLNVSKFVSQHPGGELAIWAFAGKDAATELD